MSITCLKHMVKYENGVCYQCEEQKKTVTISYKRMTPAANKQYLEESLADLEKFNKQLMQINLKLKKLLKDNREKE